MIAASTCSTVSEELIKIIRDAANKYGDSIDEAVDYAFDCWSKSPDYGEWTDFLVRSSLRTKIHCARHHQNQRITKHHIRASVIQNQRLLETTGVLNDVASETLDILTKYSINGRRLGSIFGKELKAIAQQEHDNAVGCEFCSELCMALMRVVPADKTVGESVSSEYVKKIMQQIRGGQIELENLRGKTGGEYAA